MAICLEMKRGASVKTVGRFGTGQTLLTLSAGVQWLPGAHFWRVPYRTHDMRRPAVFRLPPEVLAQLHNRMVESHFYGFDDHRMWLADLGYEVSKSALHRYAKNRRAEILAAHAKRQADVGLLAIRAQCLDIASHQATGDAIFAKAEKLYAWVTAG